MNSDEKGSPNIPLICGVVALAVIAVVGGLWLKRSFAADERQAVAAVQSDNWAKAASQASPSNRQAAAGGNQQADPQAESQLGSVMAQQNRTEDAIAHYREAVRLYREQLRQMPASAERLNNLAWMLAANPFPEIRNGKEAVELAKRACELTDWREAVVIGTLGAAYAEAGQFDEAAKMAQKARIVALANSQPDIASKNEKLAALYQARKTYREPY